MKKLIGVFALFSIVLLAGCGNQNDVVDETATDTVNVENWVDETTTDDVKTSKKDYMLSFTMNMKSETEWSMDMDISVHKRWTDVAYVFNKMESDNAEMMQFIPKQIIVLGDTSYTQLDRNWELVRLETPAWEDQFVWGMFDFDQMEEAMEAEMDSKETEKIDWKKMTCYYKADSTEESKACIYEGIIYLMESKWLTDWTTTTMKVYEYSNKVNKNLFKAPKETITVQEMMADMMKNMEQ